jgi:hypothetical protein
LIGCVSSRESGNGGSIAAFDEVADELAEDEDEVADAAMLRTASDRFESAKEAVAARSRSASVDERRRRL